MLSGGTIFSGSPATTVGTEIMKSLPKSRRALPEIVLATSPTRSHMFSCVSSVSPIRISITVSIGREAVKYTMPRRLPAMLMTPVNSWMVGRPSCTMYGEPTDAGWLAAVAK